MGENTSNYLKKGSVTICNILDIIIPVLKVIKKKVCPMHEIHQGIKQLKIKDGRPILF